METLFVLGLVLIAVIIILIQFFRTWKISEGYVMAQTLLAKYEAGEVFSDRQTDIVNATSEQRIEAFKKEYLAGIGDGSIPLPPQVAGLLEQRHASLIEELTNVRITNSEQQQEVMQMREKVARLIEVGQQLEMQAKNMQTLLDDKTVKVAELERRLQLKDAEVKQIEGELEAIHNRYKELQERTRERAAETKSPDPLVLATPVEEVVPETVVQAVAEKPAVEVVEVAGVAEVVEVAEVVAETPVEPIKEVVEAVGAPVAETPAAETTSETTGFVPLEKIEGMTDQEMEDLNKVMQRSWEGETISAFDRILLRKYSRLSGKEL